ncbi:MAG TPA: phage terminase large subunit [Ruminiclostridium sp.]|nr:phage terminase large subunit [Ruminiclostridium sp.]
MKKRNLKNIVKLMGFPSKRQSEFLKASTKYVAYGGARGGGKSWALRRKCILLSLKYPGIRILILRRTLQELRENHTLPLRRELDGFVSYSADEKALYFPNKSRIKLGYLSDDGDVNQYQGQEYDVICMDEATQFSEFQFTCLNACLRGGSPKHPKRFYITCNPGGVGHAWVKRLFIDKSYKNGESPKDYTFIPAKVFDNDFLMRTNPDYLHQLESLPEDLRRAWLYGEWDAFAGQFFPEFNREIHVVRPFEIPENYTRYYVNDYGLDMLAGLWIAVSPQGRAFVYREIYKSGLVVSSAAKEIKALERENENVLVRLAPPDLWGRTKDSGKSVIEIFADNELYFCKADNDRKQGWMALREWLKPEKQADGTVSARLCIFENCLNLIRTLPLLQYDRKNSEDAAKEPHELTHAPDALRYFAAWRAFGEQTQERAEFEKDRQITKSYLCGLWN